MATREPGINKQNGNISRLAAGIIRRITEPSASVELKQRPRVRLLAAFLILMVINTLAATLLLKDTGSIAWVLMLIVSTFLLGSYIISRSRFYRPAILLAVIFPAVPPVAITLLQPAQINLTAGLMWLALPVLAAGLLLTLRQTYILAFSNIVLVIVLTLTGFLTNDALAPLTGFMIAITFFVIAFASLGKNDRVEIEKQLIGRQQVEQTLRESEEKYRSLFELAQDAIILSDMQTGNILDVNKAGINLLGLSKGKIVGMHYSLIYPADKVEEYQKLFNDHPKKEALFTDDLVIQRANGKQIPVNISTKVISAAGKTFSQSVLRDMTEYKLAEKAINQYEQQLAKVFRLSPQQIIITRMKDGMTIDVNDSYTRVSGYTREETVGRTSFENNVWVNAGDRERMLAILKEKGRVYNETFSFRIKSGEILTELYSAEPIEVNGEQCILAVVTDITEQKRKEQTLKDIEERFSKAFKVIPESIAISRVVDGVFLDVNETFCRTIGRTREEVIGHTGKELGIYESHMDQREEIIQQIKEQHGIYNRELIVRPESDNPLTTLYSGDIVDIGGEPCMISINMDITERKRMETALRESEEKFAVAFRSSPDIIAIVNNKTGVCIEVNESFCRATGYAREELIGHPAVDMWVYPEDSEKMKRILNEYGAVKGEEFSFRDKAGEIHRWLCSCESVTIGNDPCTMSVATDITERKKMEKALQESQESLSKAFQVIPESISISRVDNGIFLDVNETFCRFTGRTREELIGHTGEDVGLYESNPDQRERIIKTINEKHGIFNEEVIAKTQSGNPRTVLYSADIIDIGGNPCLISTNMDITERKIMEKALRESEEKFSKAFRASPEIIVITRVKDNITLEVNDSFVNTTGFTREDAVGHSGAEMGIWKNREDFDKMHRELSEKGRIFNEEYEFVKKSGETLTYLLSVERININGDDCLIAISTDITERKKMEQALRESEEKFSKAFHAIPEAISISRQKDGVFIDVNNNYCRHNGLKREEVIGHTAIELGLWDESGKPDPILQGLQTSIENIEFEVKIKNGEMHTVLMSAEVFNINGEPHVLAIGNDITERKNMEKALRESEEKFSKAFHAIPDAISISRQKDGVFIDVNKNYCRHNELKRDEVIGRTAVEMGLWDQFDKHDLILEGLQKQPSIENMEFEIKVKSGELHTVLMSAETFTIGGEPHVLCIGNDITERKNMEKALRESEEKFFKAFHAIPDAVAIVTLNGGIFLEANESFFELNGYSRDEVIGHSSKELDIWVNADDRRQMTKLMKENGRFKNLQYVFRQKSGNLRNVLFSAETIHFGGKDCMLSIGTDITDLKHMEQALQESEEKFSRAFHAIPEAVSISRVRDGVFLDVNEGFCRDKGFTREEAIGRTSKELHLWDNPKEREDIIRMIKEQGRISNLEYTLKSKPGQLHTMLLSADIIVINDEECMITISNDITERKHMEESLANESIRRRILIDQSSDGIVILDANGGVYEANRRFAEMLGYTQAEMTQLSVWDWEYLQTRERLTEMIRTVGEAGDHFETQHRRKDGSTYNVEISTNGALITGQKLIFCVCRDITERKQAEEKLKEAMSELEFSSSRLKATNKELESFSYSVSHDLRSPLRSIDGFSQALLEDYAPQLDETAKDYLNRLRHASQKMGDLIDGLLKLSRLTRSEMHHEVVNLTALAKEISTRLQETHPERKAEFVIHNGLNVKGDPQMLRVLMENLIGNAWKFTGKVPEAHIEFGTAVNGKQPTFFIKDNGAGFDMSFKDKLFGAFQRLHDTADFPGTGIGLATVQRIINRHGGNIRAEAAIGKGATFYFTLS